jgi:peptidoglycan/xylan/chitin deacetylase (PgdA/CDA1 family)
MATAASEHAWLRSTIKRAIPAAVAIRTLDRRAARSVLLTFDDGPHPDVTPAVLERLDQYGAKAVFFVVGRRVRRAPRLLAQMQARGHLIGNHTQLHRPHYVLPIERRLRFWEYYRDVRRCQELLTVTLGQSPQLFRPPGGRLTPVTILAARLLGLRTVQWSREVADWRFRTREDACAGAATLATMIEPRDIVLLHDNNPCIVDVLDHLLPALAHRGLDLSSAVKYV